MMDLPFVTVFTMTYNQRHKVLKLVDDLGRQDYPADRFEFVVLDDGGSDGTADAVESASADVAYRLSALRRVHEADYLSARRWNECIAAASPETSVFVQVDDVRVRPDFVRRHAGWHEAPAFRLVTGSKFEGDDETWELASCVRSHLAGSDGTAQPTKAWTAFWGASLSYSRALVDALTTGEFDRPFDESMSGWGFHELEFAYRAFRAGAELVYDPGVGVFHQNHTPTNDKGRGVDHARQVALGSAKNEKYLLDKHGLTELPRW